MLNNSISYEPGPLSSLQSSKLTDREKEIMVLWISSENITVEEIAKRLSISAETVKSHIKKSYEKLEAHDRFGAFWRFATNYSENLKGLTVIIAAPAG
jgi:DNA-binding CsgD family transcriptional regulator